MPKIFKNKSLVGGALKKRAVERIVLATEKKNEEAKKFFSFSLGQMLLIWLNIGLIMALTLAVGFYIGRDYGVNFALENQDRVDVRVPLVRPIMPSGLEDEIKATTNEVPEYLTPSSEMPTVVAVIESSQASSKAALEIQSSAISSSVSIKSSKKVTVSSRLTLSSSSKRSSRTVQSSAKKVSSSSTNLTPRYKWYIQAIVVPTKQEAEEIVNSSSELAKQYKILPITNSKGKVTSYKVIVGPFKTQAQAEAKKEGLKKNKKLAQDMFVSRFD
ncbi:MAG: SPOR domain-containing protein [Deltaproteobacteria bacterium]|jgi:cell division protein FtsN|nr:SPOR domain-containing protein [Deltaproteobacteria bacterium]